MDGPGKSGNTFPVSKSGYIVIMGKFVYSLAAPPSNVAAPMYVTMLTQEILPIAVDKTKGAGYLSSLSICRNRILCQLGKEKKRRAEKYGPSIPLNLMGIPFHPTPS